MVLISAFLLSVTASFCSGSELKDTTPINIINLSLHPIKVCFVLVDNNDLSKQDSPSMQIMSCKSGIYEISNVLQYARENDRHVACLRVQHYYDDNCEYRGTTYSNPLAVVGRQFCVESYFLNTKLNAPYLEIRVYKG